MNGRRRKPKSAPAGRFVRGRRLDRNPLRRASDRIETVVLILLAAVFLVAAPLAAPACGAWAHAMAQRAELAQAASRYQVAAVVLTVPAPPAAGYASFVSIAQARWTAPDGAVVTSELLVPAGTRVGATFPCGRPKTGSSTRSL
jgi:hypothetical protein